jgi:hypothetical protein
MDMANLSGQIFPGHPVVRVCATSIRTTPSSVVVPRCQSSRLDLRGFVPQLPLLVVVVDPLVADVLDVPLVVDVVEDVVLRPTVA